MNEYQSILTGLIELSKLTDQIKTGIIIGSRSRTQHPADEYSDIDIIMLVDDIEHFIKSDEWLDSLGKYHISFSENTIANGKERRVVFDNALDADFLFLKANDIDKIEKDKDFKEIIARSYCILFDKIGFDDVLRRIALSPEQYFLLSESEFVNIVNDFWFHSIWAAKKVLRGELWVAKNCVDNYMKNILLQMIELFTHAVNGSSYDTWHCGRFIEQWAEPWIVKEFPNIFAGYSANDIFRALSKSMDLFRKLSVKTAEKLNYIYPNEADMYAANFLESVKKFR
ncbi:aminoglycoside 6-adenylyltransferase [Pseudobacteroides cellulosolvens]|uniref:Adenylyltransferase n=1 Tax=Pseudobacteroides cellulosolvens ATCC 35603 = DSM 2933 TaxID=398512 RepID=A0A0L6JIP1_9FIRM|nr:aminoglycoside 6-adenylyltransferase [Pseudobacteroides cellulosolvens]KNY25568.1 adenylyltransferase [Pseudobacteroides cellulosolvens ATCC 35603 = DSM 2933]